MKYKRWSLEEKLTILASSEEIGTVETCRKYGVSTGTFYSWKKKLKAVLFMDLDKYEYY
jgi:putative transposase